MREETEKQQRRGRAGRGNVRNTVVILATAAALIYLGFIARGVLGA